MAVLTSTKLFDHYKLKIKCKGGRYFLTSKYSQLKCPSNFASSDDAFFIIEN